MKSYFAIASFTALVLTGVNAANNHSSEHNSTKTAADREVQPAPSVVGLFQVIGAQKTKGGMPSSPTLNSKGSKSKSPSPPAIKSKGSKSKSPSYPTIKSKGCKSKSKKTYTRDADFDGGVLINVNHDTPNKDQLQLNSVSTPLNFIWIALSGRGTIAKVDTLTGTVLGEYKSAPDGRDKNPSRTTVDLNGNVWAGNRDESYGGKGSIVHIGLLENAQCVDRNNNGVIDTSTGLNKVKPWTNIGGVDDNGGVSTAEDECIIHYTRTAGTGLRTIAVDARNDVWTGGLDNRAHEKIDGETGVAVPGTQFNLGCGGYGGLIDDHGILWSSSGGSSLLRYDTNGLSGGNCITLSSGISYGLGIDTNGYIWNTDLSNGVRKIAPDGTIEGTFSTGVNTGNGGVAVTSADNNVWIASRFSNAVSRLDNNGNFLASIAVGSTPTGVAVDAAGKVWVTNLGSDNAMRIDPATNAVDLTVDLGPNSAPYDYSDMTGSTLAAPPKSGTWTVTYDSCTTGMNWSMTRLNWNADIPSDSSLTVEAESSADGGVTWSGSVSVTKAVNLSGLPPGRLLKIRVIFRRATTGASPVLYDLTIARFK